MKNSHSWMLNFVVIGLLAASPAVADLTLARVNGQPIDLDDMKRAFERQHQGHMTILDEEDVVRDFLESMVRRELFTQEGHRMRIADLPAIREQVALERVRIAGEWLFQSEVKDRVQIKEKAIEAAMERMRISMEVILIQTDERDQAERARQSVLAGAPAAEVARAVSRARSSVRGGLQGLAWGQTDMPAVEFAALAVKAGEVTPVVPVEEGFCFVKVLSREELDLPNPDASRRVASSVLRSRGVEIRRHEYLDELRTRYGATVDETLLEPGVLEPLIRGTVDSEQETRVIARWEGGALTLAEYVTGIDAARFLERRPAQRRLEVRQLLENRLDSALLRAESIARWDSAPATVRAELQEEEDDLVFRHLMGSVVFEDLEVAPLEVDRWYAEHRDEYMEPPSIHLAIALLETEEEAAQFLIDADSGARFADLATSRSQDPETAKKGGVAGWVTPSEAIPELREDAFAVAVNTNGGPIRLEAGFLVYRVLERREPYPTPEDEARASIRSMLLKRKSKERMETWEAQLRDAAIIRVNDSAIRKACRILTREKKARKAPRGDSE